VIKAPDAICASSTLAAASLAAQGLADVHIDGRVHPLSLWFVSVAESGERKSAVDREAMRAAIEYEKELARQYAIDFGIYSAQLEEWRARREHAKKASAKRGGEGLADALLRIGPEPVAPLLPRLTVADFTAEGVAKLLMAGRPSIGAFTDEASVVFGGHALSDEAVQRTAGMLCKLWDGDPVDRIRAADGAVTLRGRRMAMHLLGQPVIVEKALANDILCRQGFLARCLLSWPMGTAGTRTYVAENLTDDPAMVRFRERLLLLHRMPLPTSADDPRALTPRALHLEPDAAELWRRLHDAVEKGMRDAGPYRQVQAWASKTPEQALRIAGVLALIDDPYAPHICKDVMARAAELAIWHLAEAVRLIGAVETSPEILDAEALLGWCHATKRSLLHSQAALQYGPSRIRDRDRFVEAVKILESAGWARREPPGTEVDGAKRRHVWRIASREE
jgi:hypothetical protein